MAANPQRAHAAAARKASERAKRLRDQQTPAKAVVVQIQQLIDAAYTGQKEPWGRKWAPLKYRKPPPPPLQLTGDSRATITVRARAGNIRFNAHDYLYFHISGTERMPKRNPTPFMYAGGKWVAKPQLKKLHAATIKRWVTTGKV